MKYCLQEKWSIIQYKAVYWA